MIPPVPRADDDVDRLYQLPLEQFAAARKALAAEREGAEAAGVRALAKPSRPAWAVNQLYWRARKKYDALIDTAQRLRTAHRGALAGRKVDLRAADEAHRRALTDALKEAVAILEREGHPVTSSTMDALSNTLSALPVDEEAPGRLTRPLSPAGFELFAGVTPKARVLPMPERREAHRLSRQENTKRGPSKKERAAARRRLRAAERALGAVERRAREADARVARATKALEEAQRDAREVARALDDATAAKAEAERHLRDLGHG
jgi:hypothetical protein